MTKQADGAPGAQIPIQDRWDSDGDLPIKVLKPAPKPIDARKLFKPPGKS